METSTEQIGNVLKISVTGRLVAGSAEEFKQLLRNSAKTSKQILLDLSNMNFIDSTGLGAIVFGHQEITQQGGQLKIACLQAKPRVVFDITKVYRIFDIYDDVETAVASFK
ncbi:MAG: STAS domain-containing protein [Lentisphaeria bacterium]|nr:STAS domain-containing protein [Victivallales bacterium]MBR6058989.1 STAS domain-containing protein [Victivallales bacterium]MCR4573581.1 STAS domain-containing protein [Lentisphaeria bacterium]